MDTEAAVEQAIRMIEAGAEYVRFTAQGEREARNLGVIRKALTDAGYATPLVADIHFNPKAADAAAREVEKVRINPGNYVDGVKTFDRLEYTDEEYASEIRKIRERFVPFLELCKKHRTAIRIGVNHGSLSDRIMSRYGDTPEGMVASCMEFLRICREEDFADVVISIKASNTVVMVRTVRLLVDTMEKEDMHYPLHLGVTEAGDGEDGRIKSAVGIGTLLADGIGDTIRVSLSEDPEAEMPVARKLVGYIREREEDIPLEASPFPGYDPLNPSRYLTRKVRNMGNGQAPVVISDRSNGSLEIDPRQPLPDYFYIGKENPANFPDDLPLIVDVRFWNDKPNTFPCFTVSEIEELKNCPAPLKFIRLSHADLSLRTIEILKQDANTVILLSTHRLNGLGSQRAAIHKLITENCLSPVILQRDYHEPDVEFAQIKAAVDFGALLLDGFGDGILLQNDAVPPAITDSCMFGILQATRSRISKTEYISCPGCGRTLFNLQATIARVKEATSHLKGLKIGIMGCIVNGPGEMADADYGYIGAGRGRISLYKGKERILKNIPEEEAVERLIELIKENGDW
jgi:(E)-4-hydroxy-3-methylbut-2-enyl-diphosphate synthase